MKTRDKLIKAMHRADLSGFDQVRALAIYDDRGFDMASRYVVDVSNNIELEATQ